MGRDFIIDNSKVSVSGYSDEEGSYPRSIMVIGNIEISGNSIVNADAKYISTSQTASALSGVDLNIREFFCGLITASGNITFKDAVKVKADASDCKGSYVSVNGILAGGTVNFALTEGGSVTGVGNKAFEIDAEDSDRSTIPAGIGIATCYQEPLPRISSAGADSAKINIGFQNYIAVPSQGNIVSGNLFNVNGTDYAGTYQAIGKGDEAAQTAVVENPKSTPVPDDPQLNTKDHLAYIQGYENGDFRPTATLTRAECAAMLARLTQGFDEAGTYKSTFTDVDWDAWYANYVGFLQSLKIVNGYGDGNFQPYKAISRAEFTTMVVNYFNWDESSDAIKFTDLPKNHWAYAEINEAYIHGFVQGYPDNTFRPENSIERQHAVILLNRALGRHADTAFVDTNPKGLITFGDVVKATAVTEEAYYAIMEGANSHDYTKDANGKETWVKLTN